MRRKMPAENTQNTEMSYVHMYTIHLLAPISNYTDIGGLGYRVYI